MRFNEYAVRKVKKSEGMKFNGIHQLLVHADDANLVAANIGALLQTKNMGSFVYCW
jgi:hypothetical protein